MSSQFSRQNSASPLGFSFSREPSEEGSEGQQRRRDIRLTFSGSPSGSLDVDQMASTGSSNVIQNQDGPTFRHQRRSSHTHEHSLRRVNQSQSHSHEEASKEEVQSSLSYSSSSPFSSNLNDIDQLYSVIGIIPASRVTTHTLPSRVVVYVSTSENKTFHKGRGVYISQSEPPRKREDYGLEATSKEKRTDFDTSNVKIKFSNHETDIVVDGFWKGRCYDNEIYGHSPKRELYKNAQTAPADKSGFVAFNTLCKAQKMQALYCREELQGVGLFNGAFIEKIAFKISDCPDRLLENFRLAFAWVTENTLSEFRETDVCFGPVNLNQSIFVINEWLWFPLTHPIQWDGHSNLVIEISKDESHASFSWPASGGLVLKNTSNISGLAFKDNNDSSGAYPFSNWKNPTKFRKVPSLKVQVSSPCSHKIVCTVPLNKFGSGSIQVEVAMDGKKFTKDKGTFFYQEGKLVATSNLIKNFQQLLESGSSNFSDIQFNVGGENEEELFYGHQAILASRSPTFRALFKDHQKVQLSSSNPEINCLIPVPDIRPTVFRSLLTFLYSGSVELSIETACELFKAADKYEVDDLKKSCEEFLKQNTTIESVTSLLLAAENLKVPVVRSYYLDFLLWHFDAVSKTEAFAKWLVPKHDLMKEIFISRRKFLDRHPTKEKHSQFQTPKSKDHTCDRMNVTFVSSLIYDLEKLLTKSSDVNKMESTEDFYDTTICVGEDFGVQRFFFVHKVILSSRCEVFAAMFRTDMKEKDESFIQIPNISPQVFEKILEFLYTAKADIHLQNVFELYRAADQYGLEELKLSCEEFAIQEITIDNVAFFVLEADKWNVTSVRSFCVTLCVNEFDEVSITEGFLDQIITRHDLLLEILKSRNSDTI